MQAYYPMIKDALGMFLFLAIELSVLFIIISAGVSLLQQYIPDSKIQKLLGASKGRGYLLAAGLGAITPFCTCSTIPMLRGLLRARAGFGPTVTFLFASPLLNPIIIGLFVATFGMQVTLIYTMFALGISVVAGFVLHGMGYENYVLSEQERENHATAACCSTAPTSCCDTQKVAVESSCCEPKVESCCTPQPANCCEPKPTLQPLQPIHSITTPSACCEPKVESCCTPEPAPQACCTPQPSSCCEIQDSSSCCTATPKAVGLTLKEKIRLAFVDGYAQFKQVLPYLLLGVTLGSVIYGFVPQDFIATYASGESLLAVPVAAVIGIPLYVRVEALIPLSAVLVGKGMGLGAVMALIIGGGGASLTEVILLKSLFRWQIIAAFLVVVLTMAVGAGYFFQFIF